MCGLPIAHENVMFQMFYLIAHAIRGPATHGKKIVINRDRFAIRGEEVRGVLLSVLDFVCSAHFTQRSFFLESGLTMLCESVALAGSITSSSIYAPWSLIGTAFAGQVVSDLCAFWDPVVLRHRNAKGFSE